MLEEVLIKGFQRHRRVRIAFAPSVTTLIGDNDRGKSTVIRALRFLFLNQYPKDCINWDMDSCTVKAKIDGHLIKRKKGKGNSYSINNHPPLKAIGNHVPEDVAKIVNCSEANFQDQHDLHYWFSNTPGQVARQLNAIVNLDVIDKTIANIASRLKQARSEASHTRDRYKKAKEERRNLSWIPRMDKELRVVEKLYQKHSKIQASLAELGHLISLATDAQTAKVAAAQLARDGGKLVRLGSRAVKDRDLLGELETLISKIKEVEEEKCRTIKRAEQAEKKLHKMIKGQSCPICLKPI